MDHGKEKAASEVEELLQNLKLDSGNFEDCGVTPPFSILPQEVWDITFNLLDNSKDIQSCMNSCFEWTTLLESKRTDFLFSQVLPVLEKNQKLSRSEILKMRLVSRKWNQAVLSWLQTHPVHYLVIKDVRYMNFQTEEDIQFLCEHFWKLNLYQLRNNDDCEKLKNQFFASHSSTQNPIVTRHLFISDPQLGRYQQVVPMEVPFYSSVEGILQRYGHQVYHLRLEIVSPEFRNVSEALLSCWLSLVPNLRTLHIDCYHSEISPPTDIHVHGHSANLKSLQKLQHLNVIIVERFPSDLLIKLLKKCPNLSKLYCSDTTEFTCVRPKLKHIPELYFDHPQKPAEKNLTVWSVQKLTLFSRRWTETDFKRTFKFLEQFSETLVDLSMSLCGDPAYNERLHLPRLKHLHVRLHGRTCLNFLLPLTTLETLNLDVSRSSNVKRGTTKEIIQLHKLQHKMLESNIWQKLPKLLKLRVVDSKKAYVYTKPVER